MRLQIDFYRFDRLSTQHTCTLIKCEFLSILCIVNRAHIKYTTSKCYANADAFCKLHKP